MKTIRPQTSYDDHEQYPSAVDARLSRRGFLRAALSTGAAAGVALAAGEGLAGSRRPKTYRASVYLKGRYRFKYGNHEVQRIVVQARSKRFVEFLGDATERDGIDKAVRQVLDAHSCDDLRKGKKLARLQRRIGKALVARYRKRTKRRTSTPTVVLFVSVPIRHCRGKCRPAAPYCRPPSRQPRKRR